MLQVSHLTLTHARDLRVLVQDLTFSLGPGDRMALIGEEGNGKSTLLRALYDPQSVESYAEMTGEIHLGGARVGYLPQFLLPEQLERPIHAFVDAAPGVGEADEGERAAAAAALGLPPGLLGSGRPVGSLSGGERVKLQLCCLALRQPDLWLLDEPSNDLDIDTLEWLERFLLRCPDPVLYISHDETLLERTATSVLHLELVRKKTLPRATVSKQPYRDYVEERARRLRHQEQVARGEQRDFEKQQERFRRIQQRVEHEQAAVSRQDPHSGRLLKKKMKAVKSLERRLLSEHENRTELPDTEERILLRFSDGVQLPAGKPVLDFALPALCAGGKTLARGIQLHVRGPEKIGIVGRNGAGKTTLLRELAAVLLPRTDLSAAYMPQDYREQLPPDMTPVAFLSQTGERAEQTRIRSLLGSLRFTPEEMAHTASSLSGGQQAKLLLLRLVLGEYNVLLLDEPTRNFSPLSGPVVRETLGAFPGAILSVSHDRKYLSEVCTRVYELTPDGLRPFPSVKEASEGRGGVEGKPSGFAPPRRA